jgi:hypothetical protein
MHVDIAFFEPPTINGKFGGAALNHAERCLGAFTHHFSKLTGQNKSTATRRARRLDKQNVSAHRRPGETGRYTGDTGAHGDVAFKL